VIERLRSGARRRLAAAVIVGMLTLSSPAQRPGPFRTPPAVVRVQSVAVGAQVWHDLFPYRAPPN
jgi:hypothetical protein